MKHKNLWVCRHCLAAIESHEGKKAILRHDIELEFDIEADTIEQAMQIAENKYISGEYVLENSCVTAKLMSADDGNGDCTEWVEF